MTVVRSRTTRVPYRRGTVLIVAIGVLTILAALVLTLARSMRVEAITSANYTATVQADSVEQAAEQYSMALLADQADQALYLDQSNFMAIPVGDAGYFWVIRPNFDDPTLPTYGLIDESAKLNLNTATEDMLEMLPGMTPDLADAVIDWRDENDDVTGSGAESTTYQMMPSPYQAKNADLESVEELLLVKGFTREFLYGQQMAAGRFIPYDQMGGLGSIGGGGALDVDPSEYRGIFDYVTVYASKPTTQPAQEKININTAPREVLRCLPNLTDADVDSIITQRQSAVSSNPTDNTWVQGALDPSKQAAIRNYIVTQAYQYSADIVAVSANGRSFKRTRVIVDTQSGTPKIIYRRDLSEFGWPLDPEILSSLRSGAGVPGGPGQPDPSRRSM